MDLSGPHAGGPRELVRLNPDHPGFRDAVYRGRRDAIARIALEYRHGQPVPDAPYSEQEHRVWGELMARLTPVHARRVCSELLALAADLQLPTAHIPQLGWVNERLQRSTGFRMEPVAGLVAARTFMSYLGEGVFLSTQYIRHHSRPLYTPEPDVVHEVVGHAATLAHPGVAAVNRAAGIAAQQADEPSLQRLANVYWYTLEFGVAREGDSLKAYGAGLLSSLGELQRFDTKAELLDWDLERMARTPYDPTNYQPHFFVAPGFSEMLSSLLAWLQGGGWRA